MKAVLLVSHGSQFSTTKEEIVALLHRLKQKSKIDIGEYAFLELQKPSIPAGIEKCAMSGADEIIILLNFLNSGKHVDVDIPEIVHQAKLRHSKIKFRITKPLGKHLKIVDLLAEMIS